MVWMTRWLRDFPRELLLPIGLAATGALLPWLLWAWYRFPAIGGADPGLWEVAALQVSRGEPSPVAAAYPALIAALHGLLGVAWERAGLAVAAASFAAIGPVVWVLARRLGASPFLAAIAGLAAMSDPWLALGALQGQPDTLTALAFPLAVLAALAWTRKPGWARLVPLLMAVALVGQVREHAPVVTAGLLVLLVVAPGGVADRVERLLFAGLVLLVVPTLLGEAMVLPWQQNWVKLRWGGLFLDLSSQQAPDFLQGTPPAFAPAFERAYAAHDQLRIAWLHTLMSLQTGWTTWVWLLLGFVGWLLAGRDRWVLMIGLLPLAAVPGGAHQPRHVAVLVPLAVACWVAGMRRAGRWRLWIAGAVGLVTVAVSWGYAGQAERDFRSRSARRIQIRQEAMEICAIAGPGAVLLHGNPRYLTYCEMDTAGIGEARHLQGPLVWVGDLKRDQPQEWERMVEDGFEEVSTGDPNLTVYFRPARE